MKKLYHVRLTDEERKQLSDITGKGKAGARKVNRARVLVLANDGKRDQEIRDMVGVKASFVERTRQRFAEGGVERALNDKARAGRPRGLDAKQEAFLVALTCSDSPAGHETWTMRLLARRRNLGVRSTSSGLADKMVELNVVEDISYETIRQTLKKTSLSPGNKNAGASRK